MKLFPHSRSARRALTALDVFLVIATLALLAIVAFPRFARSKARPKRISCTSNLKQVGLAFRIYANDHGDQFPWKLPMSSTGSIEFAHTPQVFRHYLVMSNELITPKALVCNSDTERKAVPDFTKFSNANLSYFVGLDAREDNPQLILSGDRNITGGTLSNGFLRVLPANAAAGWTTNIHNNAGNIALSYGSVQQVTPASLQRQLQAQDLPVIRLAIP